MKKIISIFTMIFIALLLSSCSTVVENEESFVKSNNIDDIKNLDNVDSDNIITEFNNDNKHNTYKIMLVQTVKLPPLTPEDDDFDIYKSAYYGEFELRLIKDEVIVDSLNLNDCFGLENIGFIGKFTLVGDEINGDENTDFNIGIMNEGFFEFIVFTVKDNSFKVFTFDGNKTLKRASSHHSDTFGRGTEGEIIITLSKDTGGYYEKKYYWNGDQFLSK